MARMREMSGDDFDRVEFKKRDSSIKCTTYYDRNKSSQHSPARAGWSGSGLGTADSAGSNEVVPK